MLLFRIHTLLRYTIQVWLPDDQRNEREAGYFAIGKSIIFFIQGSRLYGPDSVIISLHYYCNFLSFPKGLADYNLAR